VELLFDAPSVMERFEGTGVVSREIAEALGLTGPSARASGLDRDARRDHPSGIYRFHHVPVALADSGDVFARAYVRWLEIQRSAAFVRERLEALPGGSVRLEVGALEPSRLAATLVEGWRGEICHVALTDEAGRFARYKIVDPSFHNWSALGWAMRGAQISDFPLCNKSFNLSYCGHDL
jgi:Ni,Fe-hydrogenase III large subunit